MATQFQQSARSGYKMSYYDVHRGEFGGDGKPLPWRMHEALSMGGEIYVFDAVLGIRGNLHNCRRGYRPRWDLSHILRRVLQALHLQKTGNSTSRPGH